MATPPGPASPGTPISYDDIRNETKFIPNTDIGIYDFATFIYNDGFINDFTFYPLFYPLPSSPAGGAVSQDASIAMFYDIESEAGTDINFQSGTPAWVTTIDVQFSDNTVLSSGSNSGPNAATPATYTGLGYGTVGGNIPHWYQLDITVTLNAGAPPFTPVNVEYDTGGGFTAFPGSPTTFPGPLSTGAINNVVNGGTVYVRVS